MSGLGCHQSILPSAGLGDGKRSITFASGREVITLLLLRVDGDSRSAWRCLRLCSCLLGVRVEIGDGDAFLQLDSLIDAIQ